MSLLWDAQTGGVPKYRAVVYPEVFEGRDENTKVLRINDEITLNLQPGSILHEDFFLRTYREGFPEHRYFDVEILQQDLYYDSSELAAVILSEEDGTLKVEGVVGPKLKIRPIEGSERSENGRQAHVVDTIEDADSDNVYGKLRKDIRITERSSQARTGFDPTAYNVEVVYPELFMVCDSRFASGFTEVSHLIKYVMVSLQVVNIRYRTVSHPKVHLLLRGIEVSNYTQEHLYYEYLREGGIDALKSLYNIVEYVKKRAEAYESFDLIYFQTGYDMVAVQGTRREESLSGYAFVGSACTASREQLGEDTAYTYRGIRITAHEIGHTLGCSHDGTAIDGHVKGFRADSTNCPWDDGYLMSYVEQDIRSMRFSSCCNYDISRLSWMYETSCLRTNSSVIISKKWKTVFKLPGEYLNKDKQCQLTYPTLRRTYFIKCMLQHNER
ncbi:metalloproteinase [Dermacentor silvarum]|uniref:metalloproteinase n=1 Tax=Dermacentor silvarum TaxID=543639 RepID=UPI002101BCD3|nr:metalloproteinase [Dermacentor silvarum]